MNETVDQLCELVGGASASLLLRADTNPLNGQGKLCLTPGFLMSPSAQTYRRNPPAGEMLSAETHFYCDQHQGLVQLVQQPLARQADSRYSLIINFAEFHGDWLSLVVDARSFLAGFDAGKCELGMLIEVSSTAQVTLSSKVSINVGGEWTETHLDVRTNQVCISKASLGRISASDIQAFDIHFVFNPTPRGSIEIRRMTFTLDVEAEPVAAPRLEGVFEDGL
ncbi:hypothetical protein [Ideonella paludis]|nr:hypothetical protein [Ideonella paludis]